MTGRSFDERDIHLALDGELPREDLPAYEAWLETRADMRALSARYETDRSVLREALAEVSREGLPDRLQGKIVAAARATKGVRYMTRRRVAAVAAVCIMAGAAAGFWMGRQQFVSGETLAALDVVGEAVAAHQVYAAEKLHVVEVGASERSHLVRWLSNRVGTKLIAPDLRGEDFDLMGGRLLPSGGKAAAQFMYEDQAGERISLYVAHCIKGEDTGFRLFEDEGRRAFYWQEKGFAYTVAGSIDEKRLLQVANVTYRQLLAGR
ncbi:anti-sigma factor family protein [Nitratireductor kimnyeongensis]|uniref:Anti-sigma factor family protein n=1 Tax=Nitratireductor kimnyeongensis TaxID=430679 RepID=A0ABW0T5J1_9HYPH|nr:anti-sigma factor [Nitratireductor kimnyeongensis]QZZ35076.1 anti-sigma factor [Nitratireductor kimnyeongensis]